MILCDTGPLVAMLDGDDVHHTRCRQTLSSLTGPLITTWPCFTEAMYFLGKFQGWTAQAYLWDDLRSGIVQLYFQGLDDELRIEILMKQYRDIPMDLADASLVSAAETLGLRRIFTLDSHFHAYRINDGDAFIVVPEA